MLNGRPLTISLVLIAAVSVALLSGCSKSGLNPGAEQERENYFVMIGEPSGDSLSQTVGFTGGPLFFRDSTVIDLTEEYQRLGVRGLITASCGPMSMNRIYPDRKADPSSPSSYDFSLSDSLFASMLTGGYEPILQLVDTTIASGPLADTSGGDVDLERENLANAMVEVVRRYRDPALWGEDILTGVEVVIPVSLSDTVWDETRPNDYFISMVQTLQKEFPELTVGGRGILLVDDRSINGSLRPFVHRLVQRNSSPGFISWRYTGSSTEGFQRLNSILQETLTESDLVGTGIRLTGWGLDIPPPEEDSIGVMDSPKGAAILLSFLMTLREEGVGEVYYSDVIDGPMSGDSVAGAGLYTADGFPKMTAEALFLFRRLLEYPIEIEAGLTKSGEGEEPIARRLHMLGGMNGQGEIAVLIASTNDDSVFIQLEFIAPGNSLDGTGTVLRLSQQGDPIRTEAMDEGSLDLGPFEVMLILISGASG